MHSKVVVSSSYQQSFPSHGYTLTKKINQARIDFDPQAVTNSDSKRQVRATFVTDAFLVTFGETRCVHLIQVHMVFTSWVHIRVRYMKLFSRFQELF